MLINDIKKSNLITKVESTQTKRLIYFTKTDGNDFKYPFTAWVDMDNDKTPETQFWILDNGKTYYDGNSDGSPDTQTGGGFVAEVGGGDGNIDDSSYA